MATSQNGWTVDKTGALQDRTAVHGVTFPNGVRRGDVATVLFYVAGRFHREVEPLHPGWCWGWFVKVIEGSTSISNHASGTAIDLNAPNHPIARSGTFSGAKVKAIRRILADCDGVVRWGGDYSGRKDEMHFEINKGAAAVSLLCQKFKAQEDDMTKDELLAVLASPTGQAALARAAGIGVHGQKLGRSEVTIGVAVQSTHALVGKLAGADLVDEQALATALAPLLTGDQLETVIRNGMSVEERLALAARLQS